MQHILFDSRGNGLLKNKFLGKSIFSIMTGPSFNNFKYHFPELQKRFTFSIKKLPLTHFPTTIWCCMEKPLDIPWEIWEHRTIIKLISEEIFNKGYQHPIDKNAERKTFRCESIKQLNNVYWFRVANKFVSSDYFQKPEVCWGNINEHFVDEHGIKGRRSIMLAHFRLLHHIGFRKIYLCGVDFEMRPDVQYCYNRTKSDIAIYQNNILYETLTKRFESLVPYFKEAGLEIYNLNPDSKLKVFPFLPLEDALNDTATII